MTHPGYPMPPLHLALCLCDLPMLCSDPRRPTRPMLCFEPYRFAVPMPSVQCEAEPYRCLSVHFRTGPCRCVTNLSMHCHVLPLQYRHLITSPCHNTELLHSASPCRCVSGLTWLNFTVAHHSSVQSSYLCRGCSLQQITQPYRRIAMPTSVIPCRHNTLLISAMFCRCPAT